MTVHTTEQNEEFEEEGRASLMLVAVRYVGDNSTMPPTTIQQQAGWPGRSTFQGGPEKPDGGREPGPWQFALVPDWTDEDVEDRTIVGIESNPDFEWTRDPEELATALLSRNYLPPNAFHEGFNKRVRDEVFEALDLKDEGSVRRPSQEEPYRKQLRDIIGEELDEQEEKEVARNENRVNRYLSEHDYQTLRSAASDAGYDDGHPKKREAAEFLADQPKEVAEAALAGDEIPDVEDESDEDDESEEDSDDE